MRQPDPDGLAELSDQRVAEGFGEGEAAWKVWRWPWVVRWGRLFSIVR